MPWTPADDEGLPLKLTHVPRAMRPMSASEFKHDASRSFRGSGSLSRTNLSGGMKMRVVAGARTSDRFRIFF